MWRWRKNPPHAEWWSNKVDIVKGKFNLSSLKSVFLLFAVKFSILA